MLKMSDNSTLHRFDENTIILLCLSSTYKIHIFKNEKKNTTYI